MEKYVDDFNITPHTSEVYYRPALIPGYAWIFPCSDKRVNVGLGLTLDQIRKKRVNIRRLFNEFLDSKRPRINGSQAAISVDSSLINMAPAYTIKRSFNGAVLVGDAATRLKQTLMFDLPIITKAETQALMKSDIMGGGKRVSR